MAPKTHYHHYHRREDDPNTTTFHTARPLSSRARLLVVGQKSGNMVVSARDSPVRLRTRRKEYTPSRRRGEGAKYYHGGSSSRRSVSPRRRSVSPRHRSESRHYNDRRSVSPRRDRASNRSSRQRGERRSPSPSKYHHRSHHHHNDRESSSSPTKHRRHYDDHDDHDHRGGRSSPRRERSQIQEDDNFSGDEGFELERRTPSFWGKTRQPKITSTEQQETTAHLHYSNNEEDDDNHNKKKKKKKKKDKDAERYLVEEVEMMLQPERTHRGALQTQVAMRSKVKRVNKKKNNEKGSKHLQGNDNNNVGTITENDTINQNKSFLDDENITHFIDTIKRSTSILDEEFIDSIKKKASFLDEENITQLMDTIKRSTSIADFSTTIKETSSMLDFGTIKRDTSILDEENLDEVLDELARKHDKKWVGQKAIKEEDNMLSYVLGKSRSNGGNDAKNALTNGDDEDDNSHSEEGTNSHSELTDGTGSFDSLSITNEKNSCFACFDKLLIEDEWDITKNKYLLENGA